MKPADRPSYARVLATVIGMLSRRAPLPLLAEVVVGVVLMAANVLVFFLLERVMAQVAGGGRPDELVGPILVVGAVIVLRELLELLADPLSFYFGGKGASALTAALNEKAARLEIVEFETLAAHKRLGLAKQGVDAAVYMLLFFLFPVNQLIFFVMAAGYLFSLSPLLALVIPLMFAPRIASHLIHGSRYYRLERKTVPLLREFQYLERCLVDREYFKETRVLGAGAHLLQRYPRRHRTLWRGALARGRPPGGDRPRAERARAARLRRVVPAGGAAAGRREHRRRRVRGGDLRGEPADDDDPRGDEHVRNLPPVQRHGVPTCWSSCAWTRAARRTAAPALQRPGA